MKFKIQPWKHQLDVLERVKDLNQFAILAEMGTGKTGTLINILRYKFNERKKILKTLIITPPITISNWKVEWEKHSDVDLSKIVLLKGSEKDRIKKFTAAFEKQENFIAIMNYESTLMKDLFNILTLWKPEVLVLDESHKVKSLQSKRTKQIIKLSSIPQYKYLLTGTPILNSPMDLFSQFLILDGGETFGKNFWAFRGVYFVDKNAHMPSHKKFPNWQIKPGSLEKISKLMSSKSVSIKKADCLDLPPLVNETVRVEMTPEQSRMYAQMKKDFITFMNGEAVVATLAITKALRLMQISSGFVKTEDGDEISIEKTPKMEALKELLSELTVDNKVIIWAVWKENYSQIKKVCEELKIKYVEVHGDVTEKNKQLNVDSFNNDETVRVFIGHPGSGGIGINLIVASYTIFYSRNFSLEQSLQAEARNYRGGSEIHNKITRIDIVTEGTIDELIVEKLQQKIKISEKVLVDMAKQL